jgi:hypothetical protein
MVKLTLFDVPLLFVTVTVYSPDGRYTPAQDMMTASPVCTTGGQEVRVNLSVVPFEERCGEFTE